MVAARLEMRKELYKECLTLRQCEKVVLRQLAEEAAREKAVSFDDRMKMWDRSDFIEAKVLDLNLGYDASDFNDTWYQSKLITAPEELTDEGWEKIKPKVLKLLARIRRTAAKRKDVETLQDRQKKLRPSYDKLKASLPKSAQPFMPLYTDFLLFESVKSLWANDKLELTDEAWHDSFDAILEEVEQYRVDLAHHARTAILAANGLEDEDGDDEPDFGAHFFHKPTSTLACALANCSKAHRVEIPPVTYPFLRRTAWVRDEDSVGTIVEVLNHQHELHNFNNILPRASTLKPGEPQFHLYQPPEIASAISGVLEIAGGDPDEVTREDLSALNSVGKWEWENSTTNQRFAWRRYGWIGVLRIIKHELDKANKSKPPRSLPPPDIVYHPVPGWQAQVDRENAALYQDSDDEEEEKDEQEKVKEEPISSDDEQYRPRGFKLVRGRDRRVLSSSDEEEEAELAAVKVDDSSAEEGWEEEDSE